MRLMPLARAVGAVLARDIASPEPGQMPILRSGARLTETYISSLTDLGVSTVWIEDDLSQGIEPHELVPPHVRQETATKVAGALNHAQSALDGQRGVPGAAAQELKSVVSRLLECVADSPGTALVLVDLASADSYAFQHSIDVCALGLLIGRTHFKERGWEDFRGERRFDDIDGRLLKLGLGLLLHDAGKLVLGEGIGEDDEAYKEHPEAGARLLDSPAFSPLVRAVAREHHEHWDGSGYPRGLKGKDINELARIAAVANVYDIITSDRPGSPGRSAAEAVAFVNGSSGTLFDPEMIAIFRRVVVPYPVGSEVTLPDGKVGVVTEVPPDRPDCPIIRLPREGGGWEEQQLPVAA